MFAGSGIVSMARFVVGSFVGSARSWFVCVCVLFLNYVFLVGTVFDGFILH